MRSILLFGSVARPAAFLLAAGWALAATAPAAASATCHVASGQKTVPLVELFTSEGCDSCPPADRWLSAQFSPQKPSRGTGIAKDAFAIALAFHVDYWDRLGWRDRFASAQFTKRQYDEMSASGATFVYTPQVLVQGRDAPGWSKGGVAEAIAKAARRAPQAVIGLDVTPEPNALQVRASATIADVGSRKNAVLWLAFTDSGHVTDVAAGENRGVRLRHDNVVRSLHGPYAADVHGVATASLSLARPADPGIAPSVVAFVQDAKNGAVLQSVAVADCREP